MRSRPPGHTNGMHFNVHNRLFQAAQLGTRRGGNGPRWDKCKVKPTRVPDGEKDIAGWPMDGAEVDILGSEWLVLWMKHQSSDPRNPTILYGPIFASYRVIYTIQGLDKKVQVWHWSSAKSTNNTKAGKCRWTIKSTASVSVSQALEQEITARIGAFAANIGHDRAGRGTTVFFYTTEERVSIPMGVINKSVQVQLGGSKFHPIAVGSGGYFGLPVQHREPEGGIGEYGARIGEYGAIIGEYRAE
ncbi:hypothetical protein C8R44DRAFT_954934 [Mycena epipterygia]|nr:hypothetical protein C8R44DRAFT_954934 [Mycena epipterygia]